MIGIGMEDASAIERAIARVEAATGAQVVAAVVPRADDYPEAPWRAFALVAAVATLAVVVLDALRPQWTSTGTLLWQALAILLFGGLSAIAARYVPMVRRWFIGEARAQLEVRQHAEVLFLSRELFATPQRSAVLILVAELERRVVVVPDAGFRGRVASEQWRSVVAAMQPALRAGRTREAFERGLAELQSLLNRSGYTGGDGANRLPDALVRGDAP